jgi:hypothetical protein
MHTEVLVENLKEGGHLEGPDFREIRREVVDWVHLAQDSDQWRALVNK